jgi:hypothetical protein
MAGIATRGPTSRAVPTGVVATPRRGLAGPHSRVLALQRAAGNRAVAQLARQPQPSTTDAPRLALPDLFRLPLPATCLQTGRIRSAESVPGEPELRRVTLEDGSLWQVRRRRRVTFSERFEPLPPSLSVDSDADRVWVQLDWCSGSHGTIQLGANPQQAANEAFQAIFDTVRNGGSARDALEAASRTNVTPFLDFDIGQSRSWRVTGHVEVTLNRDGFRGASGSADVQIGTVHVRPRVTLDDQGRPTGGGVDIVFGDSPPAVTCRDRQRLYARQHTEYDWTPWVPEHDVPTTTPWTRDVPSDYYVYFDYANDRVNASLSATQRTALIAELQRGGTVTGITAFTSPEGSHEAQGPNWRGNTRLADDRAVAARAWVESAIAEAGSGSIAAGARVGREEEAELYTLRDPESGTDVEGRPLESHAQTEFGSHSEEDRHRADVEAELRRARGSRSRAEVVYRRLRRAVITVTRTESGVTHGTRHVPGAWDTTRSICNPVPDRDIAAHYPRFNLG